MQNSDKLLAVYLRVTVSGQRLEVSTQRYVEPVKWSVAAGKMKGNSEEARRLNQYLYNLKQKVYEYQKAIIQNRKVFTKATLRQKWYVLNECTHTLVEVFKNHNGQLETLIGICN